MNTLLAIIDSLLAALEVMIFGWGISLICYLIIKKILDTLFRTADESLKAVIALILSALSLIFICIVVMFVVALNDQRKNPHTKYIPVQIEHPEYFMNNWFE